jgi:hypothetical protein
VATTGFNISKEEWLDFRREVRNKLASPTEQPKPTPGGVAPAAAPADAAMARVNELEFKMAIKDAIIAGGVSDPKLAKLIEQAARAERPTDMTAFVAEYASVLPRTPAVTAPTTIPAPVVVAPSTNTGPPAPTITAPGLPANPAAWPEDVIRKTPVTEFMNAMHAYQAGQQGRGWTPYAQIKRPHER